MELSRTALQETAHRHIDRSSDSPAQRTVRGVEMRAGRVDGVSGKAVWYVETVLISFLASVCANLAINTYI